MIAELTAAGEDRSANISLHAGWEMLSAAEAKTPATLDHSGFRAQSAWLMGSGVNLDASEHWFRCAFEATPAEPDEEVILRFGGIATLSEVWLNGEHILTSSSMFTSHDVNVSSLIRDDNELLIVCRSLSAALLQRRRQLPVLRWKTKLVAEQQLRWFRTTLLGRAPGFSREPAPVGPWRPVTLVRRHQIALDEWARDVSMDGSSGVIQVRLCLRTLDARAKPVSGHLVSEGAAAPIEFEALENCYIGHATLRPPRVMPWMPHTHGEPKLYPLRVELQLSDGSAATFEDVPVGFRTLEAGADGLALRINGTPVFCRGVVWTPPDVVTLAADPSLLRQRLELLRNAGFNLIRLAGTTVYEDETFHNFCDELGLLVWQDMMFANMDYPFEDSGFREIVRAEAHAQLSRLGRHASLAVVCGNSEIEQQVGMLGLPGEISRDPWFGEELPEIAARHCPGVPYVPSAPCGGDLPFRTRQGVANYFGVGAYLRPLEDVRRAEVRFASECLAFANVPEPEVIDKMALATPGGISPTHPVWKRGVPRDCGAAWDFEDVRDHYLKLLHSVDPAALRGADCNRYWNLSRMVSGEVMAEVFGEWRRPASPCCGGIILWAADMEPGAGWGILDFQGQPKSAYWFLKRVLAPCAVWMTDEGLNGIDIHVANDNPVLLDAWLRVALYRAEEQCVGQAEIPIAIPQHKTVTFGLERILGRFMDAAYAYRFGPPGHDVVCCSLHKEQGDVPFSQSFRFPAGYPAGRRAMGEIGMVGHADVLPNGGIEVSLTSRRLAWGVRLAASGFLPDDAYFSIEPGCHRRIVMTPQRSNRMPANLTVTAMNAEGSLPVEVGGRA